MIPTYFRLLNMLVESLVGSSNADAWWNSPNKAFDSRTPMSLMNEQEWIEVRDYLIFYAYGTGGS